MATSAEDQFSRVMSKANDYHKKALWQEKLRVIQDAIAISEQPGFKHRDSRRQELLSELGAIRRRLGQYDRAESELRNALQAFPDASPLKRANILGELSVVLRHANKFQEAGEANREQYECAISAGDSIDADVEACRSIGNLGMVAYNMSQLPAHVNRKSALLPQARMQLGERIDRARRLQSRLREELISASFTEAQRSRLKSQAQSWEIIGLDRLSLVLIALGHNEEALEVVEQSQSRQTREDPTVTAYSRFFYGNALWKNGRQSEALAQWNQPRGTCSSPMVFCKEPAQEHNEYLKLMADAGVDFDSYDEQGFSALDYAVLSDNPDIKEAIPIIKGAIAKQIEMSLRSHKPGMSATEVSAQMEDGVKLRMRQAQIRRQYRTLLQEYVRPEMRNPDHTSALQRLRQTYARFLASNPAEQQVFSKFHFVRYQDFKAHGRLPVSSDGLTQQFATAGDHSVNAEDNFIIFFSYRWMGHNLPDDENNTQWRRMLRIMDRFLESNPAILPSNLALWVDYACIDQVSDVEKARGVDALPLAVTLCNAMVSLVDATYHDRAWCAVEVMMMSALVGSYGIHEWWEHDLRTDKLVKGLQRNFQLQSLKLSQEVDRPKIDFLMRQSKLLGKDDA